MSDRLDEIRGRVGKATIGPWISEHDGKFIDGGDQDWIVSECGSCHIKDCTCGYCDRIPESGVLYPHDAEFIAHSREDIPYLLSEVDRYKSYLIKIADRGIDGKCECGSASLAEEGLDHGD